MLLGIYSIYNLRALQPYVLLKLKKIGHILNQGPKN